MEDTEIIRKRRRFDNSLFESSSIFKNTKHNLLQDFDASPTKELQVPDTQQLKSSFSKFLSPEDESVNTLKREMRLKDADIISLKAKISKLENSLASADLAARQAQVEQDKAIAKYKSERDHEVSRVSELRSKLQYVMEKEKGAREDWSRMEQELMSQKMELDKKLIACHREKRDAENSVHTWRTKCHKVESELQDQLMKQKREVLRLQSLYDEAQVQLTLREKRILETSGDLEDVNELRDQVKQLQEKNKNLERQLSENEDNIVMTRAFKADLDMVPKMKSELEKLRVENEQLRYNEQNCRLLEENVRSLKKKLEYAETRNQKVTELEVENEELQGRLARWEAHDTSGSRRPQSPCSLSKRVSELEASQVSATLKEGELQTKINSLNFKLEQAQIEQLKLSSDLSAERSTLSQQNDLVKRLRRKLLLLTKERDSYKSLLDSYESEVTVNFDSEKQAHMHRQEENLRAYRREAEETEAEMARLSSQLTNLQAQYERAQQQIQTMQTSGQSSKQDQETIRELKEQLANGEIKLAKVQEEKDILEARIEQRQLQGDYDPSKTKILHFSFNPCAIAQEARQKELDSLREEVEKLQKRNQILEEHGGKVEDITMQVSEKLQQPSPSKEVEELKDQLKRQEMRNKRLMEVFKKTSQEFREICYQLTGYKIDIPLTNQYRLTSMYAESSKDYLLFQQNEQGEIQMLETDYSTTLKEAMEMYLQKQHSIPVFLSSITMDLFSRQTMHFD